MAARSARTETPARSTRQWLTKRQANTVGALLEAGLEAIREVGYDGLSLRDVASRAGVTHTTAYNYFTSKGHLVAEINWHTLRELPTPEPDPSASLADRLTEALRGVSGVFSAEPAFAEAALAAMVARDPDIERIRSSIGAEIARRIQIAMGDETDPRILDAAVLLFSGAMLQAGLGYFTFDEVVDRIRAIAELWVET